MRISRSAQLYPPDASIHMFWRCHNKEYYLNTNYNKALYMQSVRDSLKKDVTENKVSIHAYCVMNNHYHQATSYKESSKFLSNHMRSAHTLFGIRYNRNNKRSGKVAEGRPKTSLIENTSHEIRVHFYIEANPIRAGICTIENLKTYKYSTYRYYAYGISDENTQILTIPTWYIELGSNSQERQKKYRKLFREYLNDTRTSLEEKNLYKKYFIGSTAWILSEQIRILNIQKLKPTNTS